MGCVTGRSGSWQTAPQPRDQGPVVLRAHTPDMTWWEQHCHSVGFLPHKHGIPASSREKHQTCTSWGTTLQNTRPVLLTMPRSPKTGNRPEGPQQMWWPDTRGTLKQEKGHEQTGKKPDKVWVLINNHALEPVPGCYKCQKGKLDKGYTGTLCTIFATFL